MIVLITFCTSSQFAKADGSDFNMSLIIPPSMTIEISNVSPTVTVTPTSSGTFASTSINVSAHSNGSIGYSLIMTPSSANLTGSATSSTIPTLSSGSYTSSNFPAGFWGISIDSNNYTSAATTTLFTTTSANTSVVNSSHTIGLATKLDLTDPSDVYTNSIDFSVVSIAVQSYPITFEFDGNITSVAIKNPDGTTKATISTSGSSALLDYSTLYTIVPAYAEDYEPDSIALSSGAGIINQDDYSFITGSGAGTITLASIHSAPGLCTDYRHCMQTMNLINCPAAGTNAVDARDGKTYSIKLINNQCWMTQNLRYLGDTGSAAKTMAIHGIYSNVADKSITLYSLKSSDAGNFNAYSSSYCGSSSSYSYACVYDSGDTTTGAYYNYYAATAGTISGTSDSTNATSDICPAGWHLPSGPNVTSGTDLNKLFGNTISGYQDPTAGLLAFGGATGGYFYNGSLSNTGYGYWWTATSYSGVSRNTLGYNSSNGRFSGSSNTNYRYYGQFIRCVSDVAGDLTVTADSNVTALSVRNGSASVKYTTCTKSGNTFTCPSLNSYTDYYLFPVFAAGYAFSSWAKTDNTSGAGLSSTTNKNAYYHVGTGSGALTLSSKAGTSLGYMQDLTMSSCASATGDGYIATDKRDGNVYSVRNLYGQCWMTQNLRYLGDTGSAAGTMTIGNNYSNVTNKSITLYSLDSSDAGNFNAYSSTYCGASGGYNFACVYDSGDTTTGVFYNYYAATAETISAGSNSTNATSDICPAGWHLPSGPNTASGTDLRKLMNSSSSVPISPTDGLLDFNGAILGYYYNGSPNTSNYGNWWTATSYNASNRYVLRYDSNNQFNGSVYSNRVYGNFIRCVRSS